MSYQPDKDEVFFCGQCKHQKPATGPIKCPSCNSTMVSWYTNRESHSQALEKWKKVNGK